MCWSRQFPPNHVLISAQSNNNVRPSYFMLYGAFSPNFLPFSQLFSVWFHFFLSSFTSLLSLSSLSFFTYNFYLLPFPSLVSALILCPLVFSNLLCLSYSSLTFFSYVISFTPVSFPLSHPLFLLFILSIVHHILHVCVCSWKPREWRSRWCSHPDSQVCPTDTYSNLRDAAEIKMANAPNRYMKHTGRWRWRALRVFFFGDKDEVIWPFLSLSLSL